MVNKTKLFYDLATIILLILVVVAFITVFLGPTQASTEEEYSNMIKSMFSSMRWFAIMYAYSLIYTIVLIVLIAQRENVTNGITMVIGSLILPGLLPLVYYLFFLRKKL